ncbi:MAG: LpxI family protein [Myxococcota bacterium]
MLGLIAGEGTFPLTIARSARSRGTKLLCVALRDMADPEIESVVDDVAWIHLGEAAAGIAFLKQGGVHQAVIAGKVPKRVLYGDTESLRFDEGAEQVMGSLADRKDDTIMLAIADFLAGAGIELLPQWSLSPELLLGPGPLGKCTPTPAQQEDIAFGLPIAKKIGELDIGQTVVVKDRAVLAVEAIEGTDAAIRRAGTIARGGCVVKVAKPDQDPRFDVPAIGPRTVEMLLEARASVLAFEAGATIVLEREAVVARADAEGLVIVGVEWEVEP